MKYKILKANYTSMEDQVNNHITKGWELYGFPFALNSEILQAVTFKGTVQDEESTTEEPVKIDKRRKQHAN